MSFQKTYVDVLQMPNFRNKIQGKCELNFAKWVSQFRSPWKGPTPHASCKWGQGPKLLQPFAIYALVLFWKLLFENQIHDCSKAFLFSKLNCKCPSYASTPDIHPFFVISAWLISNVPPIRALMQKYEEKVDLPV